MNFDAHVNVFRGPNKTFGVERTHGNDAEDFYHE